MKAILKIGAIFIVVIALMGCSKNNDTASSPLPPMDNSYNAGGNDVNYYSYEAYVRTENIGDEIELYADFIITIKGSDKKKLGAYSIPTEYWDEIKDGLIVLNNEIDEKKYTITKDTVFYLADKDKGGKVDRKRVDVNEFISYAKTKPEGKVIANFAAMDNAATVIDEIYMPQMQ